MILRKITVGVIAIMAIALASSAMASINIPAHQNQEQSFKECSMACSQLASKDECQEFRRLNQLCGEKKSVWPHYTAAQLEELEC